MAISTGSCNSRLQMLSTINISHKNPIPSNLIILHSKGGREVGKSINFNRQTSCSCFQRYPVVFERQPLQIISSSSSFPLNLSSRTRGPLSNCSWRGRGIRIGRRLLVGGAFWQGLLMAQGEGSSISALARAKKGQIEEVLKNVEWPEQFPYKKEDFDRFDESADQLFYSTPRFVTHIDEPAINAVTNFYASVFPSSNTPDVALLDMCSSWVSHYPKGYNQDRIVGMGMNEDELQRNTVLTEYIIQDLNVNPKLPFEDNTFDVITNVVSVDYLNKPLDVFKEMRRTLKPQGLAIMSFSNRCFWTKAISIWTSTSDADHVLIVGSYFHYAGGFEPPQALDISPNPGRTDPMYVVFSRKLPV